MIKEKLYAQRERVEEKKRDIERIERKINTRLKLIERAEKAEIGKTGVVDVPRLKILQIKQI